MRVEIFSLCDAATADGGKLNMLGVFDSIWTSKMPNIHPQCTIALRIRFERNEQGSHCIMVNFVNEDGKHIIPTANGTVNVQFPDNQRSGSANVVLNIQGLKIGQYGEYSIDLSIDGRNLSSLPLFVKKPN